MKAWTSIEIERAKQSLEQESATVLGRMIFEFSRLDMSLGLALVWSDSGSQLEHLSQLVADYSFHKKLDFAQQLVEAKYKAKQEPQSTYGKWLKDAHAVRAIRNGLIHGRWGIDPMKNKVINVIGLPTSPDQKQRSYSIAELKTTLDQMVQLQVRLAELREKWPL